jgi:hypothetical protein
VGAKVAQNDRKNNGKMAAMIVSTYALNSIEACVADGFPQQNHHNHTTKNVPLSTQPCRNVANGTQKLRKSVACDPAPVASISLYGRPTHKIAFQGNEGLLRGYEGVLRGLLRGKNLKPYNAFNPFDGFEWVFR